MGAKMGRPIGEGGPKDKLLQVRVDDETLKKLDRCAKDLGITRSHAVRMAVNRLVEFVKDVNG